MSKNDILERVKKLFALSSSPNEHEAALAMSKAKELLEKHELSLDEAILFGQKGSSRVEQDGYQTMRQRRVAWMDYLFVLVKDTFDVHVFRIVNRTGIKYIFTGLPEDVAVAKYTTEYLVASIEIMALGYKGKKSDYKYGVVLAVKEKFDAMKVVQPSTAGTALVVRKGKEINEYFKQQGTKFKKSAPAKKRTDWDAVNDGKSDGRNLRMPGTKELGCA